MARGQLFPFPAPGTYVPGLIVSEYQAQGFILVAIALTAVSVWLVPRMARGLDDGFLPKLLVAALAAKMLGTMTRLWTGFDLFGFVDVKRYHEAGEVIGNKIRHLDMSAVFSHLQDGGAGFGTTFTELYTGVVYTIIGPSLFGGFLVFGFLSFLGSYFFYRAFRVAFPDSQHQLYGLLVFFYPSLIYWANGIGKDTLMILFTGVAAYGTAILLVRRQWSGFVPLVLGLAGTMTVRPHITAMLVLSLVAAMVLGKQVSGTNSLVIKGLISIVGIGLILLSTQGIMEYVGIQDLSVKGAVEYHERRLVETYDGGSAFNPPTLTDPLFIPKSFALVLFRPYPWEAHRLVAVLQGLDGILLIALIIWRAPSLGKAILRFRSDPYVIYIVVYVLMLVFALTTIANFGTLVRERAMILPLLLMLVAFTPFSSNKDHSQKVR